MAVDEVRFDGNQMKETVLMKPEFQTDDEIPLIMKCLFVSKINICSFIKKGHGDEDLLRSIPSRVR